MRSTSSLKSYYCFFIVTYVSLSHFISYCSCRRRVWKCWCSTSTLQTPVSSFGTSASACCRQSARSTAVRRCSASPAYCHVFTPRATSTPCRPSSPCRPRACRLQPARLTPTVRRRCFSPPRRHLSTRNVACARRRCAASPCPHHRSTRRSTVVRCCHSRPPLADCARLPPRDDLIMYLSPPSLIFPSLVGTLCCLTILRISVLYALQSKFHHGKKLWASQNIFAGIFNKPFLKYGHILGKTLCSGRRRRPGRQAHGSTGLAPR